MRPPVPRGALAALAALTAAAAGLVFALVPSATGAPDHGRHGSGPATIALPTGWQPEGIASGGGHRLYVGSIPTGAVLRVDAKTGRRSIVVPEQPDRAAIGLKFDRGRLFVAGGPTGRAFVYDARTGDSIADVPLTAGPTFINDVTVTRTAAYFTDSQQQQLYRLPLGARGAPATTAETVPITGDLDYDDDPQTFEANGIAAAKDGGALLVVQSRTGGLFRVDPQTGASQRVALSGVATTLQNADGILLAGKTLYVVQNRSNQIAVVRLARDLSSGRIVDVLRDEDFDVPTTVAQVGRDLFAVNARFGVENPGEADYDIVRVRAEKHGKRHGRHGRGHRRGHDD